LICQRLDRWAKLGEKSLGENRQTSAQNMQEEFQENRGSRIR
jgi:hypothetical protein